MLLDFNATFKSLPNTLGVATRFNARDPTACGLRNFLDKISEDTSLRRFIPILDIAVEEAVKAELAEARSSGRMSGFSWTSDESPEKYLRRNGIRLQITWAYVLLYKERHTWDQEEHRRKMPVMRRQYLLDLCNCYGKRGVDVFNILELQLQRIGLFRRQCSECSDPNPRHWPACQPAVSQPADWLASQRACVRACARRTNPASRIVTVAYPRKAAGATLSPMTHPTHPWFLRPVECLKSFGVNDVAWHIQGKRQT